MGLADADNAVLHAVGFMVIHVLLLTVEPFDGLKLQTLADSKRAFMIIPLQPLDAFQIAAQIAELLTKRLAQLIFSGPAHFSSREVVSTGNFAVGARLVDLAF